MKALRDKKQAKPAPAYQSPAERGPLVHPDAHERFRVLLPELVVSIVTNACLATVVFHADGDVVLNFFVVMLLVQLFTQAMLYACTYLSGNEAVIGFGWMLLPLFSSMFFMYTYQLAQFAYAFGVSESTLEFLAPSAMMFGATLFYFSRTRWAFVLLLLEVLVLFGVAEWQADLLIINLVGICSLIALYVMRSSASHITLLYEPGDGSAGNGLDAGEPGESRKLRLPALGMYGQVAVFGMAVGAVCLAVALAVIVIFGCGPAAVDTTTGSQEWTVDIDDASDAQGGVSSTDDGAPVATGESAVEVVKPTETDEPETVEAEDAGHQASSGAPFGGALFLLTLLAMIVLPIVARPFARMRLRQSIEREPRLADRVARLYLGCIDRLEAAGIVRDETETPQEFLVWHEEELVGLTEPAGFGLDEWTMLTEAYEMARYADLDPSGTALETCWKLYDALPACVRRVVGWRRYFTYAFWKM